ncbi:hypothetical protein STEG23_030312, partial [Scotinomys teguina]
MPAAVMPAAPYASCGIPMPATCIPCQLRYAYASSASCPHASCGMPYASCGIPMPAAVCLYQLRYAYASCGYAYASLRVYSRLPCQLRYAYASCGIPASWYPCQLRYAYASCGMPYASNGMPMPAASLCQLRHPYASCGIPMPAAASLCQLRHAYASCGIPMPAAASLCQLRYPYASCAHGTVPPIVKEVVSCASAFKSTFYFLFYHVENIILSEVTQTQKDKH